MTLDRSTRGERTQLVIPVKQDTGANVNSKKRPAANPSLARWQDEVQQTLRDAAALRTRMENLQRSDPKPTCKICVDATADTAFQGCGHVVCADCAESAAGGCYFCRKKSKTMKLYWDWRFKKYSKNDVLGLEKSPLWRSLDTQCVAWCRLVIWAV